MQIVKTRNGIYRLTMFAVMFILSSTYGTTTVTAADNSTSLQIAAAKDQTRERRSSRVRGGDFDHLATGFPLSGAHERASCETCHVNGIFKGTPTNCAGCHDGGRKIADTQKPVSHVPTALPCDECHNVTTWSGARFDHSVVAPGTCGSCHNNVTAEGKPTGHMVTTDSCDSCHSVRAWLPAGFNHAAVAPDTCPTCHNGSTATGKPGGHITTTASCDACHSTRSWLPASFDHTGVAPETCPTCHNGSTATGKPGGHVTTTASCDACHSTRAWLPAGFDHTNVAPGTCATCHNGSTATGKPGGHFVTTLSCDSCHSTTRWTPTLTYNHLSMLFPGRHNNEVRCQDCHGNPGNEVVIWPRSDFKPNCAGCHYARFKPDAHKKVDSPRRDYTVDELQNCNGSCHEYTDLTFTTIKEQRSGEHKTTDGGW